MKRLQITYFISDLIDEHCKNCKIIENIKGNDRNPYCNTKCEIGKKLQEYGNELNRIGGKRRLDKQKEEIIHLIKQGWQAKDIAEKLNVKPQKVHNIKYHMKKEGEKVEQKTDANKTKFELEYIGLKHDYEQLQKKYSELEQEFSFEEKQWKKAMDGQVDEQLHQQIVDEKDRLIEALKEDIATMTYTIQEQQKQLDKPVNNFESQYEAMKAKHDKLLEYITIQ